MKLPNQSGGIRDAVFTVYIPKTAAKPNEAIHASIFGRIGGFGGFGGGLAIAPRSPECTECQWTCEEVSCGPGCRREVCADVCTSVPC
jgi:hypothetical protein